MKTVLRQMILLATLVGMASASEEDYATLTKVELTARTTDNTFGTVVVQAEMVHVQGSIRFSSLTLAAKGKTMSVPEDALVQAKSVLFTTMTVSSEVGYPDKGIGPYLYVCFIGFDGTKLCRFRSIFDSKGFKEMKKENLATKAPNGAAELK